MSGGYMEIVTKMFSIFMVFLLIICIMYSLGGAIFKTDFVITGEVTSVMFNEGFGIVSTEVNFADGTTIVFFGQHNIPMGVRTLHYTSSYFGLYELKEWS